MVEKLSKAKVIAKAKQEVDEELSKKYVVKYKEKLRELAKAKLLVSNIQREIEDLELKIDAELQ